MKAILLLLIALALVLTAQLRENAPSDPIGPADELIDRELIMDRAPDTDR